MEVGLLAVVLRLVCPHLPAEQPVCRHTCLLCRTNPVRLLRHMSFRLLRRRHHPGLLLPKSASILLCVATKGLRLVISLPLAQGLLLVAEVFAGQGLVFLVLTHGLTLFPLLPLNGTAMSTFSAGGASPVQTSLLAASLAAQEGPLIGLGVAHHMAADRAVDTGIIYLRFFTS
jgi:hypothetical protein